MKVEKNHLIFSSGKRLYCNQGIVGLDLATPEQADWVCRVSHGYDGGINTALDKPQPSDDDDFLTAAECIELANHMIAAWRAFRREAARR